VIGRYSVGVGCSVRLEKAPAELAAYFADFDSAAARWRSFAIVAWEGSLRFPLLLRRLVFVT
jgi:hypothetical protein